MGIRITRAGLQEKFKFVAQHNPILGCVCKLYQLPSEEKKNEKNKENMCSLSEK